MITQEESMSLIGTVAVRMRNVLLPAAIAALAAVSPAYALTQDEANAIATDAYTYFYSLVTMDITRQQQTNMQLSTTTVGGLTRGSGMSASPPTADITRLGAHVR
jgi:hypothetical protein